MSPRFPENFVRLHGGEEALRAKSIEAIKNSDELSAHAEVIEASMDLIDYFVRRYESEHEDQLTVQLLGIRLFNASAAALKLLLGGYHQPSALQQRDILETIFLLDYFHIDNALISAWRSAGERERSQKFRPVRVRTELDNRDGFTGRRREAAYKLLCELAGHPTYVGFQMLKPGGGDAHCGPFFEVKAMQAVLSELAKLLVQAGVVFTRFFLPRTRADYATKLAFMEVQGRWFERFYGKPFDRTPIDEMRNALGKIS